MLCTRDRDRTKNCHQSHDPIESVHQDLNGVPELLFEGRLVVDALDLVLDGRRIHPNPDRLVYQGTLVGEHAEDGALGDPGCLGNLAGRDAAAVLDEERGDRLDYRLAAIVR